MKRRRPHLFFAVGALAAFWARSQSYVHNENVRLASGLLYLKTGEFSSFHVNPPLVSLIRELPASLGGSGPRRSLNLELFLLPATSIRRGRLAFLGD